MRTKLFILTQTHTHTHTQITGTLTFLNISAPLRASSRAMSCGVDTITAPSQRNRHTTHDTRLYFTLSGCCTTNRFVSVQKPCSKGRGLFRGSRNWACAELGPRHLPAIAVMPPGRSFMLTRPGSCLNEGVGLGWGGGWGAILHFQWS